MYNLTSIKGEILRQQELISNEIQALWFVDSFSLDGGDIKFKQDISYLKVVDLQDLINLYNTYQTLDEVIYKLQALETQ